MKKYFLLPILYLFMSCSTGYYQIYKTLPVTETIVANVYENQDCRISYDFWAEGGDAGFSIYNKTNEPVTVYMDQSFYIVNGTAYDYFQARTFSSSQKQTTAGYYGTYLYGISLGSAGAVTSENATTYQEKAHIVIPARSSRSFREYKINLNYFEHCDLKKFPGRRQIQPVNFSRETSPSVFSNSITYSVSGKSNTVVHDFYVSEIKNLPAGDELKKVRLQKCDARFQVFQHQNLSPANFYVKYNQNK
ncbi:MAG: hypothetical protein EOO01_41125 [Chitinophagaceae bacterium]|nr:MAG: hypothetical protein EOO01_41125 [Chitinophagaceae bacterium]